MRLRQAFASKMFGDQLEDVDAGLLLRCQQRGCSTGEVTSRQPTSNVRLELAVVFGESLNLAAEGGDEGKGP